MKQTRKSLIRSEKGMATLESIPLMLIFVMMISYTMGSFGLVHTGILNSIAARNYAFETFRNRTNLVYHRDSPEMYTSPSELQHFKNVGCRVHTVISEWTQAGGGAGHIEFWATERQIRVGMGGMESISRDEAQIHLERIPAEIASGVRNQKIKVSPAWVITQYGMCLNPRCGD